MPPGSRIACIYSCRIPFGSHLKLKATLGNLREIEARSTRLRVTLADGGKIDRDALGTIATRGRVLAGPDCLHLLIGAEAEALPAGLRQAAA